jgi:hypothetical protein
MQTGSRDFGIEMDDTKLEDRPVTIDQRGEDKGPTDQLYRRRNHENVP